MIFIALAFSIVVALASVAVLSLWSDPFDDLNFDSKRWAIASPDDRAPMARDVLSRVRGLSRKDVINMLGQPSDRLDSVIEAGGNQLRGDEVFSYHIGSWSMYGMDSAFVCIHFDATGVAIQSEIIGY